MKKNKKMEREIFFSCLGRVCFVVFLLIINNERNEFFYHL